MSRIARVVLTLMLAGGLITLIVVTALIIVVYNIAHHLIGG